MKNYLFLPIGNIRGKYSQEPDLNDSYIQKGIEAFVSVNPTKHYVTTKKKLNWDVQQNHPMLREIFTLNQRWEQALNNALASAPTTRNIRFGTLRNAHSRENILHTLNGQDVLFILGHSSYFTTCIARKDSIGNNQVDRYVIGAPTLAKMLELSGLPKNHKWIKLNCCFGGGSDAMIPFSEAFLNPSVLACALAQELHKLGYRNIHVGSYAFATTHINGSNLELMGIVKNGLSYIFQRIPGTELQDAYKPRYVTYEEDPYRIWYDGQGKMVRWNEPPLIKKATMLDKDSHPDWARHQEKVEEWEKILEDNGLI